MRRSRGNAICSSARKAAGVVEGAIGEGGLNLLADCELAAGVAGGPFKFTVTSPYMLARTLLDRHYKGFEAAADGHRRHARTPGGGFAVRLPASGRGQYSRQSRKTAPLRPQPSIACSCAFEGRRAVHLCFGNYGGQTVQKGDLDRAGHVPQRTAGGPPGTRDGAPSGGGSGRHEGRGCTHTAGHRRGGCQSEPRGAGGRDRAAAAARGGDLWGREEWGGFIRTAASGCSNDRLPTARSRRW